MTVSTNIKCDVCNHAFTLKTQMDESIHIYDWPIEIVCPCGNRISLTMDKKGKISPNNLIGIESVNATHIGYSASLPICKEMYYTNNPIHIGAFSSAFLNLFSIYGPEKLSSHKQTFDKIVRGIIPYKTIIKDLLPFVKPDGSPQLLLKKIALCFNIKDGDTKSTASCLEIYNDFILTLYRALATPEYIKQRGDYSNELQQFITHSNKEQIQQLIECTSSFQNLDDWLIKNAYPFIADIVNRIEKYLPATFWGSIGDFNIPHGGDLNIMTIDYKQVSNDYARGFEELMKVIPFMAALHNLKQNGDCNYYMEGDVENRRALDRFVNKTNGKKKEEIYTYTRLRAYLEYTIENHIRNGKNHEDETYDVTTQTISYHYNAERADAIHQERLIDVSFRVYLQTLVMIEITQLINSIKKKLEEE